MKVTHWVAAMDGDIPIAICLEHDLVTQGRSGQSVHDMSVECELMLAATDQADREEGFRPWDRQPPPAEAIAEIRAMADSIEFVVLFNDGAK